MARSDEFGETQGIVYSAISTPRRIRLSAYDPIDPSRLGRAWDWIGVEHRSDTVVFVSLNGGTAASTASTFLIPSFVGTPTRTPNFAVFKTSPLSMFTSATSISIQASGGTAVICGIKLGRY